MLILEIISATLLVNIALYITLLLNGFRVVSAGAEKLAYDEGYHQGLEAGGDFGKRVAYNQVLNKELPRILSRYGQLQVKIINKPKTEIQKALLEFQEQELERFKMELQER